MFDVLDAINYQSYNDFVLRVGESRDTCPHEPLQPVSWGGNAWQKGPAGLQEARQNRA